MPHPQPRSSSSSSRWRVLWTATGVGHGTCKTNGSVENVGHLLVPSNLSLSISLGLSILANCNSSIICATDVGKLVAECVGDDSRVKSFSLAATSELVGNLVGEFGGRAAAESAFKDDGWSALAEVSASGGRSASSSGIVSSSSFVVVASVGVVVVTRGSFVVASVRASIASISSSGGIVRGGGTASIRSFTSSYVQLERSC